MALDGEIDRREGGEKLPETCLGGVRVLSCEPSIVVDDCQGFSSSSLPSIACHLQINIVVRDGARTTYMVG